jgi:hypothetical protein
LKTNKLILTNGQEVSIGTSVPKFIGGHLCRLINDKYVPIYKTSEIKRIIINARNE